MIWVFENRTITRIGSTTPGHMGIFSVRIGILISLTGRRPFALLGTVPVAAGFSPSFFAFLHSVGSPRRHRWVLKPGERKRDSSLLPPPALEGERFVGFRTDEIKKREHDERKGRSSRRRTPASLLASFFVLDESTGSTLLAIPRVRMPFHSPLLGQSYLLSFPPLSDMLKFGGWFR